MARKILIFRAGRFLVAKQLSTAGGTVIRLQVRSGKWQVLVHKNAPNTMFGSEASPNLFTLHFYLFTICVANFGIFSFWSLYSGESHSHIFLFHTPHPQRKTIVERRWFSALLTCIILCFYKDYPLLS